VGEKTFNEERVRKSVEKIRASKGKANQNRLESFFGAGTVTHSTLGKRPVDDKAKGKGKAGAAGGAKKPKGVGGVGGKGGAK
jgi:flap endonuclease-1